VVESAHPFAEADLAPVRVALDDMAGTTRDGDRLGTAEAHRRFHVALVALGGNRQLVRVQESILVRLQLYMALNLHREAEAADRDEGLRRHERLFAAVTSSDRAAALAALAAHGARSYLD
jgi:DNA-binding GntR family transcriptional regulator